MLQEETEEECNDFLNLFHCTFLKRLFLLKWEVIALDRSVWLVSTRLLALIHHSIQDNWLKSGIVAERAAACDVSQRPVLLENIVLRL